MKRFIAALTVTMMFTFGTFGGSGLAQPVEGYKNAGQGYETAFDQRIINRINVDNIYNNIEYLQQTPRVAATEEEYAAVQYIKSEFESYGYEAEVQPFEFFGFTAPHTVELSVNGDHLNPLSFTYTPSGEVTGNLKYVGLGRVVDLEGKNLDGKIALIQRGEISFGDKVLNAANAGAEGVIIFNNTTGNLNGTLGQANDKYVPAVSITQAQGNALVTQLDQGEVVTASLTVLGAESSMRTSHNVIASKKPTNKNKDNGQVVTVTSHHDSVPGSPGANDNASGTAMVLELARVMKNMPTDTELRFITFGAEELGLIGSRYYVNNLPEKELDRIVANFNLDMVGSQDAGDLVMRTVNGQSNLVTDLAQASSLRLNGEPTPFGQGGSSDHVPFGEKGISAALFIHSPLEPWYHTPEDTIDKISKEKLEDVAQIVGIAVYDYASFDNQGPKPKKQKVHNLPADMYHEVSIR
ncbi:M28 family peptidase [Alteribacter aurantiacus]|uniref:M28 family peptidase n=1 Tax=Alteribacter aurantiacus TaxID=254410 RepID=UPI000426419D|nr:M28 family peptidase [Alteribacter aurantiacus]